ncbi:unnamed protein product [Linum tenue]|uniref:Zinc-ribbon domain-containing protein n=1 Tax=Linum tenue TaxID=586396 RepID=A0AAV0PGL2_9ROSI|nr:unnamed protein product [Linum tenue]
MSEPANVRLVRCPKCENLLPELVNYAVYRCGGCGAVLRAKNEEQLGEAISDKSTEERVSGTGSSNSLQHSAEKQPEEVSQDVSEMDVKSNLDSWKCEEKEPEKTGIASDDGCVDESKSATGKVAVENGLHMNSDNDGLVDRGLDFTSEIGSASVAGKSGRMSAWRSGERDEAAGVRRPMKTGVEGVRFSSSKQSGEGPSNCTMPASYSCGESLRNRDDKGEANRVQYLEKDRAELLRKLDDLKEQLISSCQVVDKPKEKVLRSGAMIPPDAYGSSDAWFPGGCSAADKFPMGFPASDKQATRPSYVNHHHPEPFPYSRGRDMNMHNFFPSVNNSSHLPGIDYPYGSHVMKRPLQQQLPGHYARQPHHYFSGHYLDSNPDPFEPYQPHTRFEHPPCSCFHCYEKHHGVPPLAPPDKSYHGMPKDSMFYHHENPGQFGQTSHNSRANVASFNSRGLHSRMRLPSEFNAEVGGFLHSCPRKVVLSGGGRCSRPVAGAAPFFTCSNCSELLQLPKKILAMTKKQRKIRCGSCSAVIDLAFVNQKLVLSARTNLKQASPQADDSSTEFVKHNASYSHHQMNRMNLDFSSDDGDTSGFDFQTIDTDPTASSMGQELNSSRPQEMQSLPSSSPSSTECENSPDASSGPREAANLVYLPIKPTPATSLTSSPHHQHFDHSYNNHLVNRLGKGNRSSRSDQEKAVTNKATTRQNSMKEASLATEMDVSFNEYSNAEIFHDPGDAGREDIQSKTSKARESFFTNIIKKSFKDFTRSNHADDHGKNNVFVNGHPIQDRVLKKAEKVAGPIHPGQYWYDYRAGFWGVMGGPCLGIIPPSIEELNHPLPANCACGDTGVYVNGRELHQQDLNLLSTRGLPTERDRSYIIEITGRVLDEDTGEELDSLGRLAPTVEKMKHGFGMKAPKAVA